MLRVQPRKKLVNVTWVNENGRSVVLTHRAWQTRLARKQFSNRDVGADEIDDPVTVGLEWFVEQVVNFVNALFSKLSNLYMPHGIRWTPKLSIEVIGHPRAKRLKAQI
eukprot:1913237-Pleurochrysis_carterae.AAC.9